jgi:hypothetical protein
MTHVGPMDLHNATSTPEAVGRPVKRKSFFKRILVALHRSRRRQARNLIRRYRGLLTDDSWGRPPSAFLDFNSKKESSQNANGDQTPVHMGSRADPR